ncbi:MAG TPA: zf-HC2 domain-containing protein [Bryobacteraceae bacterium]|nr:zf-HC2 domain-containing protein [Bryobacteraceae bacterium]
MSCARWEERIALAVEGDLPARESAGLEAHLAGCPGCREFRAELLESQAVLKELRSGDVAAPVLDRIRGRVMARVAEQPARAAFPWRWMWVPVCAAALTVVLLRPQEVPEVPPPPVPVAAIPSAPAPAPIRWPRPAVVRAAAVRHQERAEPLPPLLVRFETDDPNVVIYWIVEGKEKGD